MEDSESYSVKTTNNRKASWKLANEVSVPKKAGTAKLEGKDVKEKRGSECDHFGNLVVNYQQTVKMIT